ncbi:MAG: transcription-repair coupling factor [Pseudomonadota bacterium]
MQNQEKTTLAAFLDEIASRVGAYQCSGISGAQTSYLISRHYAATGKPACVITPTDKDATRMLNDLAFFIRPEDHHAIIHLPAYHISPFKALAYHNDISAQRIRTLYRLATSREPFVLVASVDALLHKVMPRKDLCSWAELLMTGEESDRDALVAKMLDGGYTRTSIVEEPGDIAVRGSIMDIFSPLYDHPVRLEWFGDLVEGIRFFSAASQLQMGDAREIVALPAKEAVLHRDRIDSVISGIRQCAVNCGLSAGQRRDVIARLEAEGVFPELESLLPVFYSKLDTVFDYLPEGCLLFLEAFGQLAGAAAAHETRIQNNYTAAMAHQRLCVPPETLYLQWANAGLAMSPFNSVALDDVVVETAADHRASPPTVTFAIDAVSQFESARPAGADDRHLQPFTDWFQEQTAHKRHVVVACRSRSQAAKLDGVLAPYGVRTHRCDAFSEQGCLQRDVLSVCVGSVSSGFVWVDEGIAILTAEDVFGKSRLSRKRQKPSIRTDILSIESLCQGDLIVHTEHGIGVYQGLERLSIGRADCDFLLLSYQGGDKLYLPVDRMGMVQKYMGVDGIVPVVDKMGGKSWDRVRERVKKSVEKMAGALLKLYAARKVNKGFSFSPPDIYFNEFEAGFTYEETPDQIAAINDVIADMAADDPMDRLICGDVGYGKTEVALRASFIAVNDGKQVAVLVPTTVLAMQHAETFRQRFARFPVTVGLLSRLQTPREQRQVVTDLQEGRIDILIGTHRMLQKDVIFKALGLVIVDEEQRFGVKHKEKLKRMRETVDVLTLTATPIPRTLHMSLLGVRDISVISTPPEQRHAIVTYVTEYDDAIVADAIGHELKRGGQVYFVHNTIRSLNAVAERIRALVPGVRLAVAHGQMAVGELEDVMLAFSGKKIDVLVCTTIIESGLDIPSANTMLVNRADRFGLAQIYQLRGRVGRSDEQAFAYLFVPPDATITRDARKRLKVLMEHSDLGAGFQIAMNDLKIRGGGSILGASQSGHIAAVGYDMFLQLMETTVAELKGEPSVAPLEPEIHLDLTAHFPEDYISDIDQRLSAYRRLVRMTSLKEISAYKCELEDRYGKLPEAASNLLLKIMLRVLAIQAGVKRLDVDGSDMFMWFSDKHVRNPDGIVEMVLLAPDNFSFTRDGVLKARLPAQNWRQRLAKSKNILKEIGQRVNG